MKTWLLLSFLLSVNAFCLDLFLHVPDGKKTSVTIENWGPLRVNSECFRHKKECEKAFNVKESETPKTGNPASDYCLSLLGQVEILSDIKHNEFEYCVFKKLYYVDAWDLLEKRKKK